MASRYGYNTGANRNSSVRAVRIRASRLPSRILFMPESAVAVAPAFGELEQNRAQLPSCWYPRLSSPFDAEDAVQDTFVRAWRSRDRFEGRAAMRSWLYRIATKGCLDMLKGQEG